MNATVVGCLVVAAGLIGWPARPRQARQRSLGFTARPSSAPIGGIRGGWADGWRRRLTGHPWTAAGAVAGAAGVAGLLLAGPVCAVAAAAYGGLAIRSLARRYAVRQAADDRALALDALGGFAADLRAGLSPETDPQSWRAAGDLARRAGAAVTLAEETGAPLADLLDRIELDARSADRAVAAAAAQSAGVRATALLLAGLPAVGIGLGYAIGVDPLRVLLHESIGVACAAGALTLQMAGLAWSRRLAAIGAA
ncbi:MAG TPA: hypothetical protein VFE14_12505 [Micromonosporaceae bacterium]|nr:hypothetical protein [Micromonosporaceae bacterium]